MLTADKLNEIESRAIAVLEMWDASYAEGVVWFVQRAVVDGRTRWYAAVRVEHSARPGVIARDESRGDYATPDEARLALCRKILADTTAYADAVTQLAGALGEWAVPA